VRIIDVNLLIYAHSPSAPRHKESKAWLDELINSGERVGLPWESLIGFVRIMANPYACTNPEGTAAAWAAVDHWLTAANVWIPLPTEQHARILGGLIRGANLSYRHIHDAHLAALAIEHGLILCSADTDFARFKGLRWENPLARPGQVGERKVRYRTKPGTKRSGS